MKQSNESYEEHMKNKMNIATVDCADGIEQDYSTITHMDVAQLSMS